MIMGQMQPLCPIGTYSIDEIESHSRIGDGSSKPDPANVNLNLTATNFLHPFPEKLRPVVIVARHPEHYIILHTDRDFPVIGIIVEEAETLPEAQSFRPADVFIQLLNV